jgi:O-antigen biosynthesis protein WbqP
LRKKYGIDNLKPGLTGWAQINGRDIISLEQKIDYEKYYLENKTILLDTLILIKTIPYVLIGKDLTH